MDLCVRGAHLKVGYRRVIEGVQVGTWPKPEESASRCAVLHAVYSVYPAGAEYCSCLERISCHRSFGHFCAYAYAIFVRTQLLVHIPPPTKFYPFVNVEELDRGQGNAPAQHGKHMRRDSDFEASDMAIVVEKPEHGQGASLSFVLDRTRQPTQGMMETHLVSQYWMSPPGCTHMSILSFF
ncbi:hypothetical protein JCGZ_14981 [Jatropha curcas]|uniref:SWIM-type domain-containing protein n=1 Tax=Jatropha curcas TaxID=180498 RepID=A0A067KIW9_JATCU|nr:hypothetical protein JCGZ_14981 [Jatropha curcas]